MPIRESEKARYPKNWKEIRDEAVRRAGHKCEFCGVKNYATIKRIGETWRKLSAQEWDLVDSSVKYGGHSMASALKKFGFVKIVLTVAHLDHTPENCAPDNLKALCQKCHLSYDAQHHARNAAKTRRAKKNNYELFAELMPQ